MSTEPFEPRGVIPACLVPFDRELGIDERAYRRHLEDIAAVKGVTAVTANGHAGEVTSLTFDEQRLVARVTKEVLGSRVATVIGVHSSSSMEAARLARMA